MTVGLASKMVCGMEKSRAGDCSRLKDTEEMEPPKATCHPGPAPGLRALKESVMGRREDVNMVPCSTMLNSLSAITEPSAPKKATLRYPGVRRNGDETNPPTVWGSGKTRSKVGR